MRSFTRSQTYSRLSLREFGAVHRIAELLRGRIVRIVGPEVRCRPACGRRRPNAACTCRCRRRTRSRDGCRSHRRRTARWSSDRRTIFAGPCRFSISLLPLLCVRLADLHQEFSVLREFQDHVVVKAPPRSRLPLGDLDRCGASRLWARAHGRCRRSRRCLCSRP